MCTYLFARERECCMIKYIYIYIFNKGIMLSMGWVGFCGHVISLINNCLCIICKCDSRIGCVYETYRMCLCKKFLLLVKKLGKFIFIIGRWVYELFKE